VAQVVKTDITESHEKSTTDYNASIVEYGTGRVIWRGRISETKEDDFLSGRHQPIANDPDL
jgi:hypothetical protein